ncbi:uncharacterized protein LOC104907579 isoform X1 [Beta vulgaris subsp. vulgaris]|uniref:uncharacterized protein LOC104907579 isoform X1 n=1 Tax=Beta vulgaris subsp. vulgaris TaxID=3555 RepID=UPI0020367251|nr:uncharacterized protein LOC104907579 isoform X1 [Beta vulgaris subsp. vulgaris]XP_048498903.1 uncharacterized protein LOC104907579 isoform X1 [Beta vulgaris subsp. vulgaris]XP_048498904.1 uncharacterized protein LOC104907579 isoform X1 [Beta vulgaris subsp. vulgaris]
MEANDLVSPSLSSSSISIPMYAYSCFQPQAPKFSEHSPMLRLWRPQAQRNLRNQWSKLSSLRHQWYPSSTSGRTHATSLVNSYLSYRYMDAMDLGVLSDMPNIRKKACSKLLKQLEFERNQLLSSYKAMVTAVVGMENSSKSMRCFLKATGGSPFIQFSKSSENGDDTGDGGGAPVFTYFSISAFESFAAELVQMFKQELLLKRLLVVELLANICLETEQEFNQFSWADELYHGEAEDLSMCNLYSKDTDEPFLPKVSGWKSETSYMRSEKNPDHSVLQVYLTTWLAEVNIDSSRVEEIFVTVGGELRTTLS